MITIKWDTAGSKIPVAVVGEHWVDEEGEFDWTPSAATDKLRVTSFDQVTIAAVPEPSGLVLAGMGGAVVLGWALRRRPGATVMVDFQRFSSPR
jgi:hypothetical protein